MLLKDKKYITEITGISSDGNGVGNVEGIAVFVPYTAPGDVTEIRIEATYARYAVGTAERIIVPSPDRAAARCGVYEKCGGCRLRHMRYAAQLAAKRSIIESAFRRIGGFRDFSCDEMLGMDTPERYRNKCIFQIGTDERGKLSFGFYKKRTHTIVPLDDCMAGIEENRIICGALIGFMERNNITAYDGKTDRGTVKRIFIRKSASTGEIMVAVSVNTDTFPHTSELVSALTDAEPKIKSIYININRDRKNSEMGHKNILVYGTPKIHDTLAGIKFAISPESFYQINPVMTERLYAKALEYAEISPDDTVLDIYCGIGTITLAAAARARSAAGIEIVERAIADAKRNAAENNITNTAFYAGSAEKLVPRLIENGMRPSIVILDPPRKGSDEKTLDAVISASPGRIVYVSCSPATLARDTKYLAARGFTPKKCAGIDMFPATNHVETVCSLVPRKTG